MPKEGRGGREGDYLIGIYFFTTIPSDRGDK